jgi:hypothetical protein
MPRKPKTAATPAAPTTTAGDNINDWFTLDPQALNSALPAPGDYPATIIGSRLSKKPDAAWLSAEFALDDTGELVTLLSCIACAPNSAHASKRAQGLRRLSAILAAGGVKNASTNPADIPGTLKGLRMLVTIAHRRDPTMPVTELEITNVKPFTKEPA